MIFNAVTPSLKHAAAAGIGLFIAFIGLQNAGVIVKDPGTAVKLNAHLGSPDLLVFFAALLLTAVLEARRTRGAILWGIAAATVLAAAFKAALPLLPRALAASPVVAGSMLATRFQFARCVVLRRRLSLPPGASSIASTPWPRPCCR